MILLLVEELYIFWELLVCRYISFLLLCNKLLSYKQFSSLEQHLFISSPSISQRYGTARLISLFRLKSRCWLSTFASGARGLLPNSFLLLAEFIPLQVSDWVLFSYYTWGQLSTPGGHSQVHRGCIQGRKYVGLADSGVPGLCSIDFLFRG